ncbi:unnamed protein product, partial [Allacma fusca]
MNALKTSSTP